MGESNFKVVKIIDERLIVIDGGYKQGVRKGQEYEVYAKGDVVRNLQGEAIGTLDMIKAYIKPRNIMENMTVCENAETRPVSSFAELLESGQAAMRRVPCNLPVNPEDISGAWEDDETEKISVGDSVRPSHG